MPISAETLITQLDYSKHASMLLVEACGAVEAEELRRDLKSSHGGVLGTLQHIYFADRVWLSRFEEAPRQTLAEPGESPGVEELEVEWPRLLDRFKALVASFGDEGVRRDFTFRNLAGAEVTIPRWQALMHVVNHGTLHRGQVVAMLRQLGHQPPRTDLLYYYLR